ncbi:MAG: glycosyltransferase family 39 protein [Crocinitomicaceae bacterium]
MGEKNILFAAVATLLFTVHPIHTEVVASLKNRDELLAFLFVIWAGLCAFKYLEKEKISSLIAVFVLFALAMLSKKACISAL